MLRKAKIHRINRLPQGEFRKFSDAVGLLHHDRHQSIHEAVVDAIQTLVPCESVALDSWDLRTGEFRHLMHRNLPMTVTEAGEILAEVGHENPAIAFVTEHGAVPTLKISDLISVRQLRDTGFHREASRFVRFSDQAAVFATTGYQVFGFAAFRDRVFTDVEMGLLELFQPHMERALSQAGRLQGIPPGLNLTLREQEVLHWLTEGKSDGEIAVILAISVRTANNHVARLFEKLGVENRSSAVARVWRWRAGIME